ncbi:CocE/NonD family hydrolase [Nocardia gamkensis]|uniref:CocE/NonD family hydrolase n=1 Tax=Nocardia gamkensis TaxID=352869 RepID=UPI0037C523D1
MTIYEPSGADHVNGMVIEWDVSVSMDDGLVLRADVFRPAEAGMHPVLVTYGPYAKGLSFQTAYSTAWEMMIRDHPEVERDSSGRYQNWETVDPERWVPAGYVCVRFDSRGAGRSPGTIDVFSERETSDLEACIEWAGTQQWSNGRVGLLGISYYAANQWQVAARRPRYLAAICPWEGFSDWYRDATYHGGIRQTFWENWFDMQVQTVQHGIGPKAGIDPNSGLAICGDEALTPAQLAERQVPLRDVLRSHPTDDDYHRRRSPVLEDIEVPLLSCGNWGGQGLHLRGNIEGFIRSGSRQKWLEMHGEAHWSLFYADEGVGLQMEFFDHFLKDADNGWDRRPPVLVKVRSVTGEFTAREEKSWPLPGTAWTPAYLDAASGTLSSEKPLAASNSYDPQGDGLLFLAPSVTERLELTGPLAATLYVSSETSDADLFLVVRVFDPTGKEVTFQGALDPHTPVAQGWLRASHHELDSVISTPYRPYHTHRNPQPLEPGKVYELQIEILPTSIVLEPGYRIGFAVRGRDYEYDGNAGRLSNLKNPLTGVGPFLHDDSDDRPQEIYGGQVTLHTGGDHASYLLLPVIPENRVDSAESDPEGPL